MFKLTVSNVNSCSMLIDSTQCLKEFENCQHIGLIIASSALNDFNFYNNLGIEIDSTLHGTLSLQMFARKLISSISALQQLSDPFLHDPCSVSTIPTLLFVYVSDVHSCIAKQTNIGDLFVFNAITAYMQKSQQYSGSLLWNRLPQHIRNATNLNIFKRLCKSWLLSQCERK